MLSYALHTRLPVDSSSLPRPREERVQDSNIRAWTDQRGEASIAADTFGSFGQALACSLAELSWANQTNISKSSMRRLLECAFCYVRVPTLVERHLAPSDCGMLAKTPSRNKIHAGCPFETAMPNLLAMVLLPLRETNLDGKHAVAGLVRPCLKHHQQRLKPCKEPWRCRAFLTILATASGA